MRLLYFISKTKGLNGSDSRSSGVSGMMLIAFIVLFMQLSFTVSAQVCCPEFTLKDAIEICPPEGACQRGTTPNGGHGSLVACKQTYHQYTVYPNTAPYTYTWTITGGTPATAFGNPVNILWGNGASGTIKVVISGGGCLDSIKQEVCLIKGPQANFTIANDTVCLNTPVLFTNTSSGGSDYLWDFGDGSISNLSTPPGHVYPAAGTYIVTLTAFNSGGGGSAGGDQKTPCGCRDTISKTVVVLNAAGPTITHDCCFKTVCPGDTTSLCTTAVCSTYNWTVTGGVIISGANTMCIKVKWNVAYTVPTTVSLAVPGCASTPCPGTTTINVPVLYPSLPISGPTVLCVGSSGSYFLPTLPGTYYLWTTTAALGTYSFNDKNRNTPNINISFTVPGTYQIQCQYQNPLAGCSGLSVITVSVLPVFSFFGDDVVCQSNPITYFANGNANWAVTPLAGVIVSPVNGISSTITFNNPGTYTITATSTTPGVFCNLTATKVVEVIAKPILGSIVGLTVVCPNKNLIYSITSNTPGSPFVWAITLGTGTILTQMGVDKDVIVVKLTGAGPWQISVYQQIEISPGIFCQSLTNTLNIFPYAPPVVSGPTTVCVDAVTTFTASGPPPPGGFQWSVTPPNRGSIISGQGTNLVNIRWHGTPTLATVTATHCGGSGSINVTIINPPVVGNITANGSFSYCLPLMPSGLILSVTSGFPSYQWSDNTGPISGATNSSYAIPNAYFTGAGIYYFYVTVSNGSCSVTKSTYILIGNCAGGGGPPNPVNCSVDFSISPNPACQNQPVTFTAIPTGPGFQFFWDFGDGSTSFETPTQHTYVLPGLYTVTLTATLGSCTAVKTHTDTINPSPLCTITASDTMYCPGSFVTLTACAGMSSYQWYLNGSMISGASSYVYNAYNYGEYQVEVSNSFGCSDKSNALFIYEKPTPKAKITGEGSVCATAGGFSQFQLSAYYDANYSYSWSSLPAGATFSPNGSNASYFTLASVTLPLTLPYIASFILQVTDVVTGCIAYDTLCITFNEIPNLSVPFYYGCQAGPVTLTPSPINTTQFAYQWSHGQTTPVITVSAAGIYGLTITDKTTGCSASVTAAMINPKPDLSLFPIGCKTIKCKTDTLNLYIPLPLTQTGPFSTYPTAYPSITWYANGNWATPIGTGNNCPFVSTSSGSFSISVVVKNAYGCRDTAGVFCLTVKCDTLDFGDAPDNPANIGYNYATLLVNNGARHVVQPGVFLGSFVDTEPNGQPSIGADCDDLDCLYPSAGDDEDGVNMPSVIEIGTTYNITVQASVNGFLDAWIDFNIAGNWSNPGDHIYIIQPVSAGPNILTFTVPATAVVGQSYARFRFRTTQTPINYFGLVSNGEVEDYPVYIDECSQGNELDFGDAPDSQASGFNYSTILASNGARHVKYLNIRLGASIDSETDGQPNINAKGDDLNGLADEDGVVFVGTMYVGAPANIKVTASVPGFLNAWMDFNKNGTWADAGEQIFTNQPMVAGINNLSFNIPATAIQGKTYMRFRFNTLGGLTYFGLATNGEVEDYGVHSCPHWIPVQTSVKHFIIIPHNLPEMTPGDVLGVFYHDAAGSEFCGGLSEFNGVDDKVMIAFGDDPNSLVKDGFVAGEPITWKLCSFVKADANQVTAIYNPAYPNHNGVFVVNGLSALMGVNGLHVNATAAPGAICLGDQVQLNAAILEPTDGVTYTWTSQPSGFSSTQQNPVVVPTVSTVYTVDAFDGVFHGYGSASVTVTEASLLVEILPLRNINIPSGIFKCYNATINITAAGGSVTGGSTFIVQDGGNVNMIAGQKINLLPGTKVNNGGYLHAVITTTGAYCCASPAASPTMLQSEPTGFFDLPKDDSFFKVFPNPTTGTFTIELNGVDMNSSVSVEIYSMLGDLIESANMPAFNQHVFDLSRRPTGVYLVRVTYGEKTGLSKVIKQ